MSLPIPLDHDDVFAIAGIDASSSPPLVVMMFGAAGTGDHIGAIAGDDILEMGEDLAEIGGAHGEIDDVAAVQVVVSSVSIPVPPSSTLVHAGSQSSIDYVVPSIP